jgi:NAD(P)-dependent dehydrogenase (short-subunit alcohol dehydrogenase family)
MNKLAAHEGKDFKDYLEEAPRRLRINRLGEPSDVAELVTFLSTDESRWIHGTITDVDGGQNKGV